MAQRILKFYFMVGVFMTEDIKAAFKNVGIDLTDKQAVQFDAMILFFRITAPR